MASRSNLFDLHFLRRGEACGEQACVLRVWGSVGFDLPAVCAPGRRGEREEDVGETKEMEGLCLPVEG